jgi:DNA polymerase-3 subunit delta
MKYVELMKKIGKGQFDPVYLFLGEEEFLKEEAIRLLVRNLIDPDTKEFNFDLLYGGESEGTTVVDIASSYPMMAGHRVVIFRDVQEMSEADRKALLRYAANPTPSTCLILVGPKVDLRKTFYKELGRHATTVEFWPLFDNQIPTWIRSRIQENGWSIAPEALAALQHLVGSNLQELANEIDKLIAYGLDRKRIEKADVITVVGGTKVNSVYDLADSVAGKKLEPSLQMLQSLLESGESEVGLVFMLTRHFITLAKMHQLQADGVRPAEMVRHVRVRPNDVNKYVQQASLYTSAQLKRVFKLLLDADVKLKSSYQAPRLIMELLIFRICYLNEANQAADDLPAEPLRRVS